MLLPALFEHPDTLFVLTIASVLLLLCTSVICIYCYVHRTRRRRESQIALANKRLIYSSPAALAPPLPNKATDRFVFPLPKIASTETYPQHTVPELTAGYKTFDLSKQRSRYLSSDSSYTSSSQTRSHAFPSISFDAVKSKIHQLHRHSSPSDSIRLHPLPSACSEQLSHTNASDSDGEETDSSPSTQTSAFEYSLTDLFRIDLIYKIYYSVEEEKLIFQLLRLLPQQPSIEQCFPTLICKIRLYTDESKLKTKKYFSKKNPVNELFKFDLHQFALEQSYVKVYILGQQKNDKRLELGHTALVLNQYENLVMRIGHHHDGGLEASEQHIKSIPVDEDRIDLITQQQTISENEARALICLVYENDRCLLHVGLIKILGLQTLFKPATGHIHQRDTLQVKICTIVDGKAAEKKKSKGTPLNKSALTFSSSFHFDYLALHKTSVRITICYRKHLMATQRKTLAMLEFGSTHLKHQHIFQHWSDTLAAPNRPHIHWHTLQPIDPN